MFERILLPLDGSGDWEFLLPHLDRLALAPESEVTVVEAVPFLETLLELPKSLGGMEVGPSGDMDVAERYVGAVAGLLRSRGIIAREVTQVGADAETIASVARHLKATLVTLVAREPTGFLRRPTRSPAEQALEACTTPMYVIPASGEEGGMQPPVAYGRVVVPLDGTAASLEVIPAAAHFCRRFAAPMLFVHVVRSETEVWQARDVFHDALRRAEREGIPAEALLQKGEPAEAILGTCDELRGSMIAMRTRMTEMDRSGPLGSVMVQVLRAARVPMLIVRRRSDASLQGKAGARDPD